MRGRARVDRLNQDGGSAMLSVPIMELGYWVLRPVVKLLDRAGATPNAVTLFAVVPACFAAVAGGFGAFATVCLLGMTSAFCDALDGMLAKYQGVSSRSGQALDSVLDRVTESVILIGLAVYFRGSVSLLLVALLALFGGYMTSYVSAKAEVMKVAIPRGQMRRPERAVYLMSGCAFTPLWALLMPSAAHPALRFLPVVVAMALIGVIATWSALARLHALVVGAALPLEAADAAADRAPRAATQELTPIPVTPEAFAPAKSRGVA
ncbi:MAG: CDP-alcohol phosphatidyltransferase family protein [Deltaproteobacteria bacterium]|nr:CDP-alcohol phosphatidyltransferase family protein [Deltaproteobacteria bacterium]